MTGKRTTKDWAELERYSERFVKRMRFIIGFIVGVFAAIFSFTSFLKGSRVSIERWELLFDYWYVSIPACLIIGSIVGIMFNTVWKNK